MLVAMKPHRFDYHAPESLEGATSLFDQYGDDAKALAGGQSLMPLVNMRLAQPEVIVDLNRVASMAHVEESPDGGLRVGAMTRVRTLERLSGLRDTAPLLFAAIPHIGHFQIRNRGAVGGSIAHADPAAELPAVAVALGADLVAAGTGGQRVLAAEEFFETYFTTQLEPTELLTEVRFPPWPNGAGWGFEELAIRHGDYALAGVCAVIEKGRSGLCERASIVLFGVGDTPVRATRAEARLVGSAIDEEALNELRELVSDEIEPDGDVHATSEYRKDVAGVLARRCVKAAASRASA